MAVNERSILKQCLVQGNKYACNVLTMTEDSEQEGYLMVPILYPGFTSRLTGDFIRSKANPSLYSNLTNCKRLNDGYQCDHLVWSAQICFMQVHAKNVEKIKEHCNLVKPSRKSLRVTNVQRGVLVDNIQESDRLTVQGSLDVEHTIAIVPYSYTLTVSTPETHRQILSRSDHGSSDAILVSWFTESQLKELNSFVTSKDTDYFEFIDDENYKIFAFIFQILASPLLLKAIWDILCFALNKWLDAKEAKEQAAPAGPSQQGQPLLPQEQRREEQKRRVHFSQQQRDKIDTDQISRL